MITHTQATIFKFDRLALIFLIHKCIWQLFSRTPIMYQTFRGMKTQAVKKTDKIIFLLEAYILVG